MNANSVACGLLALWYKFQYGTGAKECIGKSCQSGSKHCPLSTGRCKEKVELQVSQASYKVNEAAKRLSMAEKNLEKADENLRYAKLGFMEGVIPTSNVLEAQTAWLSAQSDKIDAQIDVKLTEVYLRKSMGVT